MDPATFQIRFAVPENHSRQPLLPSDLLPSDQANLYSLSDGNDLLPKLKRHSVYLHARQELSPDFSIFLEGRYGDRDVLSQTGSSVSVVTVTKDYPFYIDAFGTGEPLLVAYNLSGALGNVENRSDVKSQNATAGFEYNITQTLQLRAYGSYSREKANTETSNFADNNRLLEALSFDDTVRVFNIFSNGDDNHPDTLAYIAGERFFRTRFSILEFNALLDGSLFSTPGGDLRFAFGGNYRKEKARSITSLAAIGEQRLHREVLSAFGELFFSLISAQNRTSLAESLTVSLSGRLYSYKDKPRFSEGLESTRQTTFNPKIGVSWEVFPGYSLRGTYGTSFATPSLANRITETSTTGFPIDDPLSPNGRSFAMIIGGIAPDIRNEKATTWTLGATLAPPQIPGLRLDATFFNIKFKDRIVEVSRPDDILAREDEFGPILQRNPSLDQIRAICAIATDSAALPACANPELIKVIIDGRITNHARSIGRGIDFEASYNFSIGNLGELSLSANTAYLIDYKFRFLPDSPDVSNLNEVSRPVDFRSRLSATWNSGPVNFTTFVNYVDDYRNPSSPTKPKVGSWTTVDVSLSYDFNYTDISFLQDTVFTLSCINLLNNNPPFVDTYFGYDATNATPLGRFASVTLIKRW
ncbi:TonB-dependent receptor domain-containing protein [Pedomonas sp. V897]|uniref:TonB-dependent receptor domain-containing protein n=1 Tax=Pedomonas sp. V897 TaxID=3446482 RepID=UPI003EE120B3